MICRDFVSRCQGPILNGGEAASRRLFSTADEPSTSALRLWQRRRLAELLAVFSLCARLALCLCVSRNFHKKEIRPMLKSRKWKCCASQFDPQKKCKNNQTKRKQEVAAWRSGERREAAAPGALVALGTRHSAGGRSEEPSSPPRRFLVRSTATEQRSCCCCCCILLHFTPFLLHQMAPSSDLNDQTKLQ